MRMWLKSLGLKGFKSVHTKGWKVQCDISAMFLYCNCNYNCWVWGWELIKILNDGSLGVKTLVGEFFLGQGSFPGSWFRLLLNYLWFIPTLTSHCIFTEHLLCAQNNIYGWKIPKCPQSWSPVSPWAALCSAHCQDWLSTMPDLPQAVFIPKFLVLQWSHGTCSIKFDKWMTSTYKIICEHSLGDRCNVNNPIF